MLTIWGSKRRFCDGLSRRDFLHLGLLGGALTLPDVLRLRAHGATADLASHKAVIMVCLNGGPSHLDMYDLKPQAPVEIRGEFRPIPTNVPGFEISELMPRQAQIADKLALVRSVQWPVDDGHHLPPVGSADAPPKSAPKPKTTTSSTAPADESRDVRFTRLYTGKETLSLDEYLAGQSKDIAAAKERFAKMDKNSDGVLTRAEFVGESKSKQPVRHCAMDSPYEAISLRVDAVDLGVAEQLGHAIAVRFSRR